MTLEAAMRRIVDCMTPEQRAEHDCGARIVDWLMDVASNTSLPQATRDDARSKLRACAHRQPHQTVRDMIGRRN